MIFVVGASPTSLTRDACDIALEQLLGLHGQVYLALLLISSTSFHQSNGRRKKK